VTCEDVPPCRRPGQVRPIRPWPLRERVDALGRAWYYVDCADPRSWPRRTGSSSSSRAEHDRLDALAADDKTTQVRPVFSWSYQALEPGPARAFRLLSLHPGPDISTPAAAALIDASIPATRRLLRTLTGGHLLEETGRDRYQFHDLVRVYAAECSQASEPESHRASAIGRLLTWYMHTADAFFRTLGPANEHMLLDPPLPSCRPPVFATPRQAMNWAESEIISLTPALRQAAAVGDDGIAWKLPATLTPVQLRRQRGGRPVPAP
jgi:hypothetical protein